MSYPGQCPMPKLPMCEVHVNRLWEAMWEVDPLLPHPDDEGVSESGATAIREFRRCIANIHPAPEKGRVDLPRLALEGTSLLLQAGDAVHHADGRITFVMKAP